MRCQTFNLKYTSLNSRNSRREKSHDVFTLSCQKKQDRKSSMTPHESAHANSADMKIKNRDLKVVNARLANSKKRY